MSAEFDLVILGASFAGIEVLRRVCRDARGHGLRILVVDRETEHGYLPLVHERLSGRLAAAASVLPTRAYVERWPGVQFEHGEVLALDPLARTVMLAGGKVVHANTFVVALGSSLVVPAMPGSEHVLTHKERPAFEQARTALHAGPDARWVVVGGGISGVELAGELAWLSRRHRPLRSIALIQGAPRLLPGLCEHAGARALDGLRAQGVDVHLASRVTVVEHERVRVDHGNDSRWLGCEHVIWAGGVAPAPVLERLGLRRDRAGWLEVVSTLQAMDLDSAVLPHVYVCGDAASVVDAPGEVPWPTMRRAIECLWQAAIVSENVLRACGGTREVAYVRHDLVHDFPHGVSVGERSLIVYGDIVLDRPRINAEFRRFLMRRYFARYRPW